MAEVIRIGNCSGFYGDRLSAMREMLEGGDLDVLTGDYLAELTMLILGRDQLKDPSLGYARTYVRQVEDCLGLALERGVRLVSNAGGLNPAGLAARLAEVATGLGLSPSIAYVDGDDVRSQGYPGALTANAYLGGFGIAAALAGGADVVVTGRVTDASLVVGPAAWWHGWDPTAYDALAGAVVAGHVIECGCQATGGNFSGFADVERSRPLGFPVAEVAADGSSVITKHAGTGGSVTVDSVTAQLLYEVQGTRYLGPDVTTDLTSIRLAAVGADRVGVTGVRGSAAARAAQGLRQRARRPPQRGRVRADRAGHRGEGGVGPGAADPGADGVVGDVDPRPVARTRRRHRGGRLDPAALHGPGHVTGRRRPRLLRGGRGARAGVVPRLHDDRPARQRHAVRRLPGRVRRPLAVTHTVHHADGRTEVVP